MTPRQLAKLEAEKLANQKARPIQKISNSFIDSALHNKSIGALKTIYYLASLLEKQDLDCKKRKQKSHFFKTNFYLIIKILIKR